MIDTTEYIKQIKEKMKVRAISLNTLARETDVDKGNLSRFLKGKGTVTFEKLIPVLKYLDIQIKI